MGEGKFLTVRRLKKPPAFLLAFLGCCLMWGAMAVVATAGEKEAPKVSTSYATEIQETTATLDGTVNPNGAETTYWFEYGTTIAYGNTTATGNAGSGTEIVSAFKGVTGLVANTTYHFRVIAENTWGKSTGNDKTFKTDFKAPTASTEPASPVTQTEATLKGSVNPQGSAATYYFEYGPTTSYGSKTAEESAGSGSSSVPVSAALSGLARNSTYHFRIVAKNPDHTVNGADRQFTTALVGFDFSSGSNGTGNGQFKGPKGIAIDPAGNVWVVDSNNNRVQKFNAKGEYLSQFGSEGTVKGKFKWPDGIAIDASGNLWITDAGNNRVQKFNSKGEYQSQFGSAGTGNGQFSSPAGIAVEEGTGNLWVVDTYNNRVQEFNSKGEYLSQFGSPGTENGHFKHPTGIAVDASSERLWVVDSYHRKVQVFNTKGEYLSQFGSEGSGNGQFKEPTGIAIDLNGDLWIADTVNNRVQKFNSSGEYIGQFGTAGSGSGQLSGPADIAVEGATVPWVTDFNNSRIQKWGAVPPWNTVAPAVVPASPSVGTTLSVSRGSWENEPTVYEYQWARCSAAGAECSPIAGATTWYYTAVAADEGHALRAEVTTWNNGGSSGPGGAPGPVSSAPTSAVAAEPSKSAQHWYACTKTGAGLYKDAGCSEKGESQGEYEFVKVTAGSPLSYTSANPSPIKINYMYAGVAYRIECTSSSGSGTVLNPVGGGAGTLTGSNKLLALSGCEYTEPSWTSCVITGGSITSTAVNGTTSEEKIALTSEFGGGGTLFQLTMSSCTPSSITVSGTLNGTVNSESSSLVFVESGGKELKSPVAISVEGSIQLKTEGHLLRFKP